jgi:hypothetical protein
MNLLGVMYEMNRSVATFQDKMFLGAHSRFSKLNNFTNITIHCLPIQDATACDIFQLVVKYEMNSGVAKVLLFYFYRNSVLIFNP